MKTTKMLTILFMALGLLVWSPPIVHGAQYLTVNGQDVTSISLELGQSRTVEVVSTDSTSYVDYVGFDNGVVLGAFSHLETKPEAGNLAAFVEYDQPAFYGYYVNATGISPAPSPGVHFVFEYSPQQGGETDLKLYDSAFTSVIDSVHITVIPLEPLPVATAFTYQGRLMNSNSPANGLYDFEFKLYDNPDPVFAAQQGNTIDINDLDVIDGYFTAELDFGSNVFNGDARWLEIAVRPGDSNDPNAFVSLSPRQEITPVPYALQTRGIFVDSSLNVGIGTTSPTGKLHVYGGIAPTDANGTDIVVEAQRGSYGNPDGYDGGNIILLPGEGGYCPMGGTRGEKGKVGIGTTVPQQNLTVQATRPQIALVESGGDTGVVEFHEQTNQLRFQHWADYGATWMRDIMVLDGDTGNVGIGTTSPGSRLEIKAASGYSDGGLRLTSSINGNQVITLQDATPGDQGQITVKAGGSDKIVLRANGNTYFKGGKVGIGTTSPDKELTVDDGTIKATTSVQNGYAVYGKASYSGDGTNYGGYFVANGQYACGVFGAVSGYLAHGVHGETSSSSSSSCGVYGEANLFGDVENYGGYFQANGDRGIGVYGEGHRSFNNVYNYGGYFRAYGQYGQGVHAEAPGSDGRGIYAEAAGSNGWGIVANGVQFDFFALGPGENYGSLSSIRWKRNVQAIDNPLEKILQLRGVYFDWDAEHGGQHDVGMIAEEVGEVLPEIVKYETDGKYTCGMDYSKLTPLLVEAVKELKGENDRLKERVEALERTIHQLAKVKELEL